MHSKIVDPVCKATSPPGMRRVCLVRHHRSIWTKNPEDGGREDSIIGEQDIPKDTQDRETIEHLPSVSPLSVGSTYELIREAASNDPELVAISMLGEGDQAVRLSSRDLLKGIHQTANLMADLGIESGDVIGLLLPRLLETHLLLWGGQAAGIVCPISPWLPGEQIVALLQAVKAKLLVAPGPQLSQELWQKAEAVRREVKSITAMLQVRGLGEEQTAVYAFDALLEGRKY